MDARDFRSIGRAAQEELRRRALLLTLQQGLSQAQAAEVVGVQRQTVNIWLQRYRAQGEDGVLDGRRVSPRRGKGLLAAEEATKVQGWIRDRTPDQLKLPFALWTSRAVRDLITARFGTALGLSKAEIAAIATFTNDDYRYINPATANDDGWMKANIPDASDSERASMKSEGTLHAGMAMEGLNKLPVWTGRTFRGEKLKPEEVAMYFDIKANNTVAIKKPSFARSAISSTSKSEKSAADFQFVGRPVPEGGRFVIWENAITNGRDIEELSVNKREQEVATLPGAQFRILSARLETSGVIRAKVVQVK
jgi:transposase